ncbi:MAG: quinone-dependent dihydroorotate dehydrogenase [Chitinophagales bacterium]|nr:quinone-dependent dihydroorotate dehydrogenase [Chitinophagales bacterium]
MNIYPLIKSLLFKMDAEKAHHLTLSLLKNEMLLPLVHLAKAKEVDSPKELFGLKFKNPVGLAAGLDKNAEAIDALGALGFGFVEIGTITPKPQEGNPKPRLFRLPQDQALINRMGFNNVGVAEAVRNLNKRKSNIIVGGNIGKNKVTPNEEAVRDYEICFNALFDDVDYFAVNVSSPNTPGLRALQEKEALSLILHRLQHINQGKKKAKPILLKIAPDLGLEQLDEIVDIVQDTRISGIIATNTTIERTGLPHYLPSEIEHIGAGGLSGKPLTSKSTEVIAYLHKAAKGTIPIIGVGGIMNAEHAIEKMHAGAQLVQLYSGFIYKGPKLIEEICSKLSK